MNGVLHDALAVDVRNGAKQDAADVSRLGLVVVLLSNTVSGEGGREAWRAHIC